MQLGVSHENLPLFLLAGPVRNQGKIDWLKAEKLDLSYEVFGTIEQEHCDSFGDI